MPRKWHIDGENEDGLRKVGYCPEERCWTFQCPRTGNLFHGDRDDGGNLTRLSSTTSRPRPSPTPQPRALPSLPEDYDQQNLRQATVAGSATYTCPYTGQVYDRRANVPAATPIPQQQRSSPLVPYQQPPPPVPYQHSLPPTPRGGEPSRDLPLRSWTSPLQLSPPPPPRTPAIRHAVSPHDPFRSRIPLPVRPAAPMPQQPFSRPPVLSPVPVPVPVPVSTNSHPVATNQQSAASNQQQSVTMQFYGQQPVNGDVAAPPVAYYPGMYYYPVVGQGQGPGHLPYPAREPAPQPPPQPATPVRRPMRKRSLLQLFVGAVLKRPPGRDGG